MRRRCRRFATRTAADLARPGLPREKVLATVVQLLEKSLIRVGNDEYAKANRSFGLTTLRNQHVDVRGSTLKFEFRGKSGVRHSVDVNDRRLARIVKQCRDLPGQELFQYIDDDGTHQDVDSQDVNAYLKEITGEDFTAKDFRTWAGTVLAATALREFDEAGSMAQAKKNVVQAIEAVAGMLGNTRTVCRKSYIHPGDHRRVHGRLDGGLEAAPGQRPEVRGKAAPRRGCGARHPAAAAQEGSVGSLVARVGPNRIIVGASLILFGAIVILVGTSLIVVGAIRTTAIRFWRIE